MSNEFLMEETLDLEEIRQKLEEQHRFIKSRIVEEEKNLYDAETNPDRTDLAMAYDLRQRLTALLEQLENQLDQVEDALKGLDQGKYGTCERCSNPISPARLKAIPHATLCIHCQEKLERRW